MIMKKAMERIKEGMQVGVMFFKDVRFANNQGMTASSEARLQSLMVGLINAAKSFNMKKNVKKMKSTRLSRKDGVSINILFEGQWVYSKLQSSDIEVT